MNIKLQLQLRMMLTRFWNHLMKFAWAIVVRLVQQLWPP